MSAHKVIPMDRLCLPTNYVPSGSKSHCNLCNKKLLFFYKHHCRVCGNVVCNRCREPAIVELPGDKIGGVKVCIACLSQFESTSSSISSHNSSGAKSILAFSRSHPRLSDLPELHGSDKCHVCDRCFSTHHPKHHCRQCGNSVCYGCRMNSNDPLLVDMGLAHLLHCWTCIAGSDAVRVKTSARFSSPLEPKEAARLEALYDLRVLDSPSDDSFAILCDLMAQEYACPIAVVAFMDVHRQWFKAQVGLTDTEVPRVFSLCEQTITTKALVAEWDTSLSPRLAAHPLVVDGPKIRFYAGAPLLTPDGHAVGSVFVLDKHPRPPCDLGRLEELAAITMKMTLARKP
ncbi:hypothetical protein ACHHYP_14770 [Achlya hypogyna]|uniref:FYVE-type domain-containing protein n=1 Tax=Achlya hypogyna TaxID=1202772 RepID=A0A1V9YCG1_ACHHY|nr:hypothetical protein ACHHYP_14770 [Achlya hypogyna]